jgi:hypothetical protein
VSAFEIEKLIASIRERHGGRTSKRMTLGLAREQGHDLIALKATCRHGEFRALIENHLPFGYAVASDLMKIARQLGNVGRRNARGSLSVRQALSLIERPKNEQHLIRLVRSSAVEVGSHSDESSYEADQCRLIEGDCLKELVNISDAQSISFSAICPLVIRVLDGIGLSTSRLYGSTTGG